MAAAAALLGTITPGAASAADVQIGRWYAFEFGSLNTAFMGGSQVVPGTNPDSTAAPDGPWTFTLGALGGSVTFLDGFVPASQFTITDGGKTLGVTSAYGSGGGCGSDISACLNNVNMSKGTFALAAGGHSLSGFASAGSSTGGGAFFRIDQAVASVPEPSSWMMMIIGFGTLGFALRRRQITKSSNCMA